MDSLNQHRNICKQDISDNYRKPERASFILSFYFFSPFVEENSLSEQILPFFFFFFFSWKSCAKIQKFDHYLRICQLFLMGKNNSNKNKVLSSPTLVRANMPFFTSRNSDNVYHSLAHDSSGITGSSRAFPMKRHTYRLYFCYFSVWRMWVVERPRHYSGH